MERKKGLPVAGFYESDQINRSNPTSNSFSCGGSSENGPFSVVHTAFPLTANPSFADLPGGANIEEA